MSLINISNVSLGYEGKPIVTNLDFSVNKGDYLYIIGENGSGKSTLMKTLLGRMNVLSGKITLDEFVLDLSDEELAAAVHMQATYFIRRFSAAYGCPPQNYFRSLKLYRAMRTLATTDLPIEEIAREIGIPDTSYFSRFFKKHCHLTPREYRAAFKRF